MQTQGTIIGRRTAGARARRGLVTVTIAPGLTFFNTNCHALDPKGSLATVGTQELNTNFSLMNNYMAIHGNYMFKRTKNIHSIINNLNYYNYGNYN